MFLPYSDEAIAIPSLALKPTRSVRDDNVLLRPGPDLYPDKALRGAVFMCIDTCAYPRISRQPLQLRLLWLHEHRRQLWAVHAAPTGTGRCICAGRSRRTTHAVALE